VHAVGIGWAPPQWRALYQYLRARGFSHELIEAAGLARMARNGRPIDVFRGRVMFAYVDPAGTVRGFSGRAAGTIREGTPKYLNTAATDLFTKGQLLYGMDAVQRGTRMLVVVEGPWDAVAVTVATGHHGVGVATNGTAMTVAQAGLLADDGRPVVVWTDADEPGRQAARDALDTLTAGGVPAARYVEVVDLDPSDYARIFGPAAIVGALGSTDPLVCALAAHRLPAVAGKGIHAQVEEVRRLGPYTVGLGQGDLNLLLGRIQQHTTLGMETILEVLRDGQGLHPGKAPAAASRPPLERQSVATVSNGPHRQSTP
jgi:DNA primase catalytic core